MELWKMLDYKWKLRKQNEELERCKNPDYYTRVWDEAIELNKLRDKVNNRTDAEKAEAKRRNKQLADAQYYDYNTSHENLTYGFEKENRASVWTELYLNREIGPYDEWEW